MTLMLHGACRDVVIKYTTLSAADLLVNFLDLDDHAPPIVPTLPTVRAARSVLAPQIDPCPQIGLGPLSDHGPLTDPALPSAPGLLELDPLLRTCNTISRAIQVKIPANRSEIAGCTGESMPAIAISLHVGFAARTKAP